MFIYSIRAGTIKFTAVILASVLALAALIVLVPTYDVSAEETYGEVTYNYDRIKTNEDRLAFLSQFGYSASGEPCESAEITVPSDFDRVFAGYNELQKSQGFDLSRYKRKTLMRYTYELSGYTDAEGRPYEGKVYANVIVYRSRVVGGDICSADPDGFIHGFEH